MANTHTTHPAGYETRDTHLAPILKFLVWLSIGAAIVFVAMWGLLEGLKKLPSIGADNEVHPLAAQADPIPSGPQLEMQRGVKRTWGGELVDLGEKQPFTTRMWADERESVRRRLETYGWIDRQAGVVHVPIERAMQMALEKGFPSAPPKPKN